MNTAKTIVSALGLFLAGTACAVEVDAPTTLVRNITKQVPGKEIILPFLSFADGTLRARFDIYPVESAAKIFSTTEKTIPVPSPTYQPNCGGSVNINPYFDAGNMVRGTAQGRDIQIFSAYIEIEASCSYNGDLETLLAGNLIYGAETSQSSGNSWVRLLVGYGRLSNMQFVDSKLLVIRNGKTTDVIDPTTGASVITDLERPTGLR